ncbi:heme-binding protein [Mycobacterium tilburgii]|uniref:heme-binding protein n=1 Tax=Mycobacterium tilburgii TaxID=44467 RepID=UPI0028C4C3AD|nr:heme-binding protein [Mycobacterium tilburgii]
MPAAAVALLAEPPASDANDPCAVREVARTIGSVSKSMGDYLDSHPETKPVDNYDAAVGRPAVGHRAQDLFRGQPEGGHRYGVDRAAADQPVDAVQAADQHPAGHGHDAAGAGHCRPCPPRRAAGLGTPLGVTAQAPSAGGTLPGPSRQNNVG